MSGRALPVCRWFVRAALLVGIAVSGCTEIDIDTSDAQPPPAADSSSRSELAVTPAPARPVLLGRFEVTWVDGEPQVVEVATQDSGASPAPLRTVPQASWCRGTLPPVGEVEPGVAYSWGSVPGTDVTETPGDTTDACARDGAEFPARGRGASCFEHGISSRSLVTMRHVTLVIEEMIPGGHALLDAPPLPPEFFDVDVVGLPPLTLGALYYGDLAPRGFAYQNLTISNSDNAGIWYEYGVYAVIDEACNGVDDDCDGEVDEDGACE